MSDAVAAVVDEMVSAYTADRRLSRQFAAERLLRQRGLTRAEGWRDVERDVAEAEEAAIAEVKGVSRRARGS